jgi:hypothetical protein
MSDRHLAEIVLTLVRGRWEAAEDLLRRHSPEPDALAAQCVSCDIHPWMHALLEAERRETLVGDDCMERLAELRRKVRRDNMALLARAEQVLDLLLGAGITPVALKGLDLLHRLYGRFDERTIDDIDLLVRVEQLEAALALLEGAGWQVPAEPRKTHYIRSSHHLPLKSPGPVTVELEIHWNLAQEERYGVRCDELFQRAEPLDVAGRRVLRLDDHDLVAHLLIHHLSHYFDRRLKWMVDLQQITALDGFRWEKVIARVREWGAVTASGISLIHMRKLMPELIPEETTASLPVAAWRRVLTWPLRSNHPLELYRNTGRRRVQLYLAAIMMEKPAMLPGWLLHRKRRDRRPSDNPLDH